MRIRWGSGSKYECRGTALHSHGTPWWAGWRMREQVQAWNPELPVFGAQTLHEALAGSLAARRFSREIVGLFALTALLLAGMGIYGVISYLVSERTHEIGIRLALGAQQKDVLLLVLGEGMQTALAGVAIG